MIERIRRSVVNTFRELGAVNGLWLLTHRALGALTGKRAQIFRYYVVAQPVPHEGSQVLRPARTSAIRQVGREDRQVAKFPRPAAVIDNRFDTGSSCFVAEVKGQFAGYLWLAFDGYDEDEVRCRFEFDDPSQSAWDYDVYVAPEYRMGRTFVRLWDAANRELAARGVRWTYSRISAFNPSSIAAHGRMGISFLFSATFLCFGNLQVAFFSAAPFLHIGWSPDSRPVLKLPLPKSA